MSILVRTETRQRLTIGPLAINVRILPRELSEIDRLGLLDCPPADYYESSEFMRDGERGKPAEVMAFAAQLIKTYFSASGGLPILWRCSKKHARAERLIFRKFPVKFTILCGSLRRDNPFRRSLWAT